MEEQYLPMWVDEKIRYIPMFATDWVQRSIVLNTVYEGMWNMAKHRKELEDQYDPNEILKENGRYVIH